MPKSELEAVLEGECLEYSISEYDRLSVVDVEGEDPAFLSRLAYTLKAAEYLGHSRRLDELAAIVFDRICDVESFRVTGPSRIQTKFGGLLHDFGLKVNLNHPDVDVVVFDVVGDFIAGVNLDLIRDYSMRRAQYRPYFHPTSMHPKLARALVNLTRVCEGDVVFDPFCGTGGVLIEAGLMGMNVLGWDVDARMVEGCRQNLMEYGVEGEVEVKNALDGRITVDAIATDPPYGRSSYASEDTDSLIRRFIKNARGMLEVGSYMSIILPEDRVEDFDVFKVKSRFDIRIHKSLTRRVWLLEAI